MHVEPINDIFLNWWEHFLPTLPPITKFILNDTWKISLFPPPKKKLHNIGQNSERMFVSEVQNYSLH